MKRLLERKQVTEDAIMILILFSSSALGPMMRKVDDSNRQRSVIGRLQVSTNHAAGENPAAGIPAHGTRHAVKPLAVGGVFSSESAKTTTPPLQHCIDG